MNIPNAARQAALFERCGTPQPVIDHGEAVARCALTLAQRAECPVDEQLLQAACRLHDMARTCPDHARAGAEVLRQEGFEVLADIVARHHDLLSNACTEAQLLFLADKLVQGTQPVSLEQRFAASRAKCRTGEALENWQHRREQARQVIRALHLSLSEDEVIV